MVEKVRRPDEDRVYALSKYGIHIYSRDSIMPYLAKQYQYPEKQLREVFADPNQKGFEKIDAHGNPVGCSASPGKRPIWNVMTYFMSIIRPKGLIKGVTEESHFPQDEARHLPPKYVYENRLRRAEIITEDSKSESTPLFFVRSGIMSNIPYYGPKDD